MNVPAWYIPPGRGFGTSICHLVNTCFLQSHRAMHCIAQWDCWQQRVAADEWLIDGIKWRTQPLCWSDRCRHTNDPGASQTCACKYSCLVPSLHIINKCTAAVSNSLGHVTAYTCATRNRAHKSSPQPHPLYSCTRRLLPQPAPEIGALFRVHTTGAALIKYEDGRENMVFFLDCAAWHPSCAPLGRLSVAWALKDQLP